MTNYTELKRLAEAATAGPWAVKSRKVIDASGAICGTPVFRQGTHRQSTANANYIAAASPDVVLSMIAEIERHRCGTEVLQRLHDEDMAERNKLRTQNQALLEALKGLQKQYAEHPDAFWDWSQARAAIKLAEGKDV